MLELPLDFNGANVELIEAQHLVFLWQKRESVSQYQSNIMRECVVATSFT